QPQQVMTPPQAQPTQGQQAPQMDQGLPPALGGANFGGNLGAGLQSFVNTPGGLLQKVLGGITGGVTGQRTDPAGIQQQNLVAQYRALIAAGLTPQNAQLAVLNPEAGKTLISEALTNKEKYQKTGVDAFGNENYGFVNERDQTINGRPIGQSGDANGPPAGGFLAPGVKQIDSSLTGKDYLGQFSPEIQAAVQNYVDGKSTPTGNPRKG